MSCRGCWLTAIFVLAAAGLFGQLSPGPLSQAHAHLEGISNCTQCHDLGNKVPDSKCLACHVEIQTLMTARRGYHASTEVRSKECIDCHSDHHGRRFDMVRFDQDAFEHAKTGYKLEGQHTVIDCRECHKPEFVADPDIRKRENSFLGLERDCKSCHDDFHQGSLGTDCASCHDFEKFRPARLFDHDDARFALAGRHKEVDCLECHRMTTKNGLEYQEFTGLSFSDCVSCHEDPHAGQLPGRCAQCHVESGFEKFAGMGRFDHGLTDFQLKGKHRQVQCMDCHNPRLDPRSIFQDNKNLEEDQCVSCHEDVHEGKFGTNCVECHQESGFRNLRNMDQFDHARTAFPLEGKHVVVDCRDCHEGGRFTEPMPHAVCTDCHTDYHEGQFSARPLAGDCAECHSVEGFEYTSFGAAEHLTTDFPLRGAHLATPCLACHLEGDAWVFSGLSHDCKACHDDIHQGHIDAQYYPDADCRSCHSEEAWHVVSFDHEKTGWPLEGRHAEQRCSSCHFIREETGLRQLFTGISHECSSCHNENHGNQFDVGGITDCKRCHSFVNWEPTLFDHQLTAFPLEGKHAEVACKECHPPAVIDGETMVLYKLESFQCIDCHF